jgi:hypothetical protein
VIDPRICQDPVALFRRKNKDGSWFLTDQECYNWVEVILDRAKRVWVEELDSEQKKRVKAAKVRKKKV